jgi:Anti-sigma-K factor rskA
VNDDEVRFNAAARALDALEPHEAAAVDAAASRSAELRDEADAFTETAARLGLAARPVAPSAGLRARLLADIARTPQLPVDGVADSGANETSGSAARPAPVSGPVPLATGGAAPIGSAGQARPAEARPAEARARAHWYSNLGLIVGAAAAALALFAGGVAVGTVLDNDNPRMEAQADSLAELYAAPDAMRSSADVAGDGTATLVWSEQLDRSAIVFDDLAALPVDSVYEAWYINSDGVATPAGTFRVNRGGLVHHLLEGSLGGGGTVGVTIEPQGGSDAPTTKPIVLLNRA